MDPQEAKLRRLQRVKSVTRKETVAIGDELVAFFKHSVQKRHTKLATIAECWGMLVPELLSDHCCLDGFSRGTLTVLVDSSPHLYELKQLLLAGLEQQIFLACKSTGLKKIMLRQGRWYEGDDQRVKF